MNRPDYIKLRASVKKRLQEMVTELYINVTPGMFVTLYHRRDVERAWPSIVKDLHLVPDPYGGWTLAGREMTPEQFDHMRSKVFGVIPVREDPEDV